MNVLKESVVVHRTVLTQMGAITVLAMMATALKTIIMTAVVTSNILSLFSTYNHYNIHHRY
jgi:hypothetical protein